MKNFAILAAAALLPLFPAQAADAPPKFEAVNSPLLTKAPIKGDFVHGKKNAPVTLVEYASPSCPHCAHFHRDVLSKLEKEYIEPGKLRYILRPFPHNEPGLKAAMLEDCVGEESGADQYYTFVRVLFEAQDKWAFDQNFLTQLKTFARVGGVSEQQFDTCTADTQRELKLLNMKKDAIQELKVSGVPAVFINGNRLNQPPTYENVKPFIDEQLAKKK